MKFSEVVLLVVTIIGLTRGQHRDKEKQIKDQLVGRNYDQTILPWANGTGPVHVNVSLVLKSVIDVNPHTMTSKLQFVLKMSWNDPRMAYAGFPPNTAPDNIMLTSNMVDSIWVPNVYFVNSLSTEVDQHQRYARIQLQEGDIHYSALVTTTTKCKMRLSMYPHDTQTCEIKITSYGHTNSDILFDWDAAHLPNARSSTVPNGHKIEKIDTSKCDTVNPTGVFSCVKLDLKMRRLSEHYLINVYIPLTMLIIVSWLSYFLHPVESAAPRVVVAVTALALATLGISYFNAAAPQVSFTKAIDVWTGFSLTFIFAALVEFAFVNFLNQYGWGRPTITVEVEPENAEQETPLNPQPGGKKKSHGQVERQLKETGAALGAKLDVAFRVAIPMLFVLFFIIFVLSVALS